MTQNITEDKIEMVDFLFVRSHGFILNLNLRKLESNIKLNLRRLLV